MVLLVNPIGDFPLNDDWDYGCTVYHLVKEGNLQFTGWTFPTVIAQIAWGALFCLPFGFSFTALRLSTIVLGLIGILATYGLLREIKAHQIIAFIGALIIATNPLFFSVSHTFLTDVPFFSVSTLSFLFLIRGLNREKRLDLLIGTLLACVATLIRQFGIVIPLSFGIVYVIKNGLRKKTLRTALTPSVLVGGILIVYMMYLKTLGLPDSSSSTMSYALRILRQQPIRSIIFLTINHSMIYLLYLGLFLLPILIIRAAHTWQSIPYRERIWTLLSYLFLFFLCIAWFLWQKSLMPIPGNIVYDFGLGAVTLWGSDTPPNLPQAPTAVWYLITFAAIIGSVMLIHALFSAVAKILTLLGERNKSESDESPFIFAISTCVLYFLCLCLLLYAADRYVIPFLPLLMILITSPAKPIPLHLPVNRLCSFLVVVLLLVYGIFSVAATHDYLSWNRSRWEALRYLTEEAHISSHNIDGGFEFNGWYEPDPAYRRKIEKNWSWLFRKFEYTDYVVSFEPKAGFKEIKRYPYRRWIPYGEGNIYILHKQ
jgi:hypothetical protein